MIDISSPTAYEREATGVGSVRSLLATIGQIESRRRDQDILNRYVQGIASTYASKGTVTEQDRVGIIAGLAEPQYDQGLAGIFQRITGAMPQSQSTVLPQLQGSLLSRSPTKRTLSDHKLALIEKKLAANPNFEGTPEHLRLLGVSGAKTETVEEKLKRLQALRKSAAGQYFGIEGGNPQPLFPKVFEYAEKEIATLPMFAKQEEEPQTIDITPQVDVWPLVPPGIGQRIKQALKEGYTKEEILKWLKEQGYNDYAGSP